MTHPARGLGLAPADDEARVMTGAEMGPGHDPGVEERRSVCCCTVYSVYSRYSVQCTVLGRLAAAVDLSQSQLGEQAGR